MKPSPARLDAGIETTIGILLGMGVLLSAAIVVFGGVVYLGRHGQSPANYQVFRDDLPELRTVWGILRSAELLRGRGIIQLGLIVLIATPVARVIFSIWAFAAERDKTYVAVATLVLCTLLYSLFGSALGLQ